MSGSLEVRQFLLQCDGGEATPNGLGVVPTQRNGRAENPRVSDDQVRRARLAVAMGARDRHDCAELLDMLGLTLDDIGVARVQR